MLEGRVCLHKPRHRLTVQAQTQTLRPVEQRGSQPNYMELQTSHLLQKCPQDTPEKRQHLQWLVLGNWMSVYRRTDVDPYLPPAWKSTPDGSDVSVKPETATRNDRQYPTEYRCRK